MTTSTQNMDNGRVDNAPYTDEQLKARRALREDAKEQDRKYADENVLRPATFVRETTLGQTTAEAGKQNRAAEGESKPAQLKQERLADANENQFAGQETDGSPEKAGTPAKASAKKSDDK